MIFPMVYLRLISIGWHFLLLGLIMGNWIGRIKDVQELYCLDYSTLGVVLIASIGGALIGLFLGSEITKRYGSCISARLGGFLASVWVPIIGVNEGGIASLIIGMIGLGFGLGWLDVSNNSQSFLIQKDSGSTWMGLFQCLFSLGGFCGALIGGALSSVGISPFWDFVYVSATLIPLSLIFSYYLYTKGEEDEILKVHSLNRQSSVISETNRVPTSDSIITLETQQENVQIEPTLPSSENKYLIYYVGCVGLISFLGEGSIGDWSTIYLRDNFHSEPFVSALGFAIFSLVIAITRFFSDYLIIHFTRIDILVCSGVISFLGLCISVFSDYIEDKSIGTTVAIIGFAICGLGLGSPATIALAIAGDLPGYAPSDAIAIISSISYIGIMVGPPLLGGLAAGVENLRWAFLLDAFLLLIIASVAISGKIPNADGSSNSYISSFMCDSKYISAPNSSSEVNEEIVPPQRQHFSDFTIIAHQDHELNV